MQNTALVLAATIMPAAGLMDILTAVFGEAIEAPASEIDFDGFSGLGEAVGEGQYVGFSTSQEVSCKIHTMFNVYAPVLPPLFPPPYIPLHLACEQL